MKNLLTKKNVLVCSSFYVFYLVIIFAFGGKCYNVHWCHAYLNNLLNLIAIVFLPFLPLFLFSLITYFMRNEVYQAWWKLTRFWIPLSIFLVLLMPEDNGAFLPIDKGHVAILMSGLFAVLSTIIILTAFIASRKKK